jgi:CO/xanthine dehydrogenase FAD-binding subunit
LVKSYIPKTYKEALEILSSDNATIIAGGTDLMVKNRNWSGLAPKFDKSVMFVSQLSEIDFIQRVNGEIRIGATATLENLLHDDNVPELLKKAISLMASPGIRHTATLAGNIGNASPAGDTLPVLYILNAKVVLESAEGENAMPIENFIIGPGARDMRPGEMIKEIIIEDRKFDFFMYEKVGGRKSDAISKVSFAGAVSSTFNVVSDIRIAFGAVAPTVVRERQYETRFIDMPVQDIKRMKDMIIDLYEPNIKPINDQRSTAAYRKKCAMNLLGKFLDEANRSYR